MIRSIIPYSLLLFALTPLLGASLNAQSLVRDAVECAPRGGLPHFFAKLQRGDHVNVAYLGSSITAQAGWRVKSLALFQKLFPKAKLEEIFAALGGTGSGMSVFRIDHDVFPYKPDLLFVQAAINDATLSPAEIIQNVEGIVRKTWKAYPGCDICFVYPVTEKDLKELQGGKLSKVESVMEQVADAYQIPSLHLGMEVARLEKEGKLSFKAPEAKMEQVAGKELDQNAGMPVGADGKIPFSRDGFHPYNDTGHQLYLEAIARSVPKLQAVAAQLDPHSLRTPLDPNNLENAVMLPLDKAKMSGPWNQVEGAAIGDGKAPGSADFARFLCPIWKGKPGAELDFRFKGSRAAIYDMVGPDCGKLEITVDGKTSEVNRIDSYAIYHRIASFPIGDKLDPAAIHEVKIRLLAEPLDKENIIMPSRRPDFKANPAKYDGLNWYAGAIFLVGELVP